MKVWVLGVLHRTRLENWAPQCPGPVYWGCNVGVRMDNKADMKRNHGRKEARN